MTRMIRSRCPKRLRHVDAVHDAVPAFHEPSIERFRFADEPIFAEVPEGKFVAHLAHAFAQPGVRDELRNTTLESSYLTSSDQDSVRKFLEPILLFRFALSKVNQSTDIRRNEWTAR